MGLTPFSPDPVTVATVIDYHGTYSVSPDPVTVATVIDYREAYNSVFIRFIQYVDFGFSKRDALLKFFWDQFRNNFTSG